MIICLDPGHQRVPDYEKEKISPNSGALKSKSASGTYGTFTKKHEYEITLEIALLTKMFFNKNGHKVFLTRDNHDVNISNIERAKYANEHNVDMCIKIHCNGVRNSLRYLSFWKRGLLTLAPKKGSVSHQIYQKSNIISKVLHESLLSTTGFLDLGIKERADLTGFNWSEVPVVLLELGYLTNPIEEGKLTSSDFQNKLAQTIYSGAADAYRAINI